MKNTISLNPGSCKVCQTCAEICPNKIFKMDEFNQMRIIEDRVNLCFQCGQCMAVCATQSIVVNGFLYETDFFELPRKDVDGSEKIYYDLIRSRRAIRNFKDKPVPKALLEKIINAISFAPPGFPPIKFSIIAVQDTAVIRQALPHMINLYDKLVWMWRNPLMRYMIQKEVGRKKMRTMKEHLIPALISRLPSLKNGTEDTLTRNAPSMILFLADKHGEDISQDISIAATYGMLASHALGLGGSIMDIIPPAIDKEPHLRKLFRVPDDQEVVTSLIIGYPKYQYLRGIKREIKSVRWI